MSNSEVFAVLISVDGQPDGDYLLPPETYEGLGCETPLDERQTLDLLERGYKFA